MHNNIIQSAGLELFLAFFSHLNLLQLARKAGSLEFLRRQIWSKANKVFSEMCIKRKKMECFESSPKKANQK